MEIKYIVCSSKVGSLFEVTKYFTILYFFKVKLDISKPGFAQT